MTIQEMKDKKKEKGYTYAQIANLSGVPLGTVQKIFSGETVNPRYDTLLALEHFFEEPLEVREHVYNRYERNGSYTVDDYRTLLMDFYMIWLHQPLDISQLEERFIVRLLILLWRMVVTVVLLLHQ